MEPLLRHRLATMEDYESTESTVTSNSTVTYTTVQLYKARSDQVESAHLQAITSGSS
jgi:hypothetical protein